MKIKKFIMIGATVIIAALSHAQAQEVPITDQEINAVKNVYEKAINNFESSKEHTLSYPIYTIKPNIKTTLVFPDSNLQGENYDKIISFYKTHEGEQILTANGKTISEGTDSYIAFKHMFTDRVNKIIDTDIKIRPAGGDQYRADNVCQVNVYIEKDGVSLRLTNTADIIELTKIQNDEQLTMNQKFLLAHESGHCEFSTIQNPIIIPGKTEEVNNKLSHVLRDQIHDNTLNNISYMSLLNENYADISAAYALIKEYGQNNKNLDYILNSFIIQRQDNYFVTPLDTHFTHFSLHEALKQENIDKMLNIQNSEDMRKFILTIANKGVLQVAADNPTIEKEIFNKENFSYGIVQSMTNIIFSNYVKSSLKEKVITIWEDSIERGLSYEVAQNILDKQNFEQDNIREYFVNAMDFALKTKTSDFQLDKNDIKKINQAYQTVEEMREIVLEYRKAITLADNVAVNVYKSHQASMDKNNVIKQMTLLRNSIHLQKKSQNKI